MIHQDTNERKNTMKKTSYFDDEPGIDSKYFFECDLINIL